MAWKLNKIDPKTVIEKKAGDWWYCPWLLDQGWEEWDYLSAKYIALPEPRRPPVCIRLPGGSDWVMDSNSSQGGGWDVSGEEGMWTCSPSILVRTTNNSGYHGYLQNGVLIDDVEGKKFDG